VIPRDDPAHPAPAAVLDAVEEIASDLWNRLQSGDDAAMPMDTAAAALLFAYMSLAFPGGAFEDKAAFAFDRALDEACRRDDLPLALHEGMVGIAWALEHVARGVLHRPVDFADGLDRTLCEVLAGHVAIRNYDFVSGLAGIGVYALGRAAHGDECLALVIDQLATTAVTGEAGTWWHTHPSHVRRWRPEENPEGYFNVGVAHGLAGVLPVLAGAIGRGVRVDVARALLDGSIRRLRRLDRQSTSGDRFPAWVDMAGRPTYARTGWCYGDAGIAAVLVATGRAGGDPAVERWGREIAASVARRPLDDLGVEDASLCHGAAGVAHLLRAAYRDEPPPGFVADAIHAWTARALSFRTPGRGGGYLYRFPQGHVGERRSMLEGTPGIALALLGAVTAVAPRWDAALGLSVDGAAG
jgi:hypothetical protein